MTTKVPSSIPKKRQELLQWNGWGYKDSGFIVVESGSKRNPKHAFAFTGNRYEVGNGLELPHFFPWANAKMGIEAEKKTPPNPEPTNYPEPVINEGKQYFMKNPAALDLII